MPWIQKSNLALQSYFVAGSLNHPKKSPNCRANGKELMSRKISLQKQNTISSFLAAEYVF